MESLGPGIATDMASQPLPAAITVFPGLVDARVSIISLDTPALEAGSLLMASLAPLDAYGNAPAYKRSYATDHIIATAAAEELALEVPLDVEFRPDLEGFAISGTLLVAGNYSLQVQVLTKKGFAISL